jgi:hypothetical protein
MDLELKELQLNRDKMVKINSSYNTHAIENLETEIFEFETRLK